MSGSWEVERWQLEYDEGLLWEGVEDSGYVVFARPEWVDSEGRRRGPELVGALRLIHDCHIGSQ